MTRRILYIQSSSCAAKLAEACLSLTPKVSWYPTDELFLEIAGTQKLLATKTLSGEAGVLLKLEGLLSSFGVSKNIVLTDKPEWARPLARTGEMPRELIVPPGQSEPLICQLPIERLAEFGDPIQIEVEKKERLALIAFMRRVGLRKIYDFARLPPIAVSRRFGKLGISLSEWVLGKREMVLPVFVPSETIKEAVDAEDLPSLDALLFALRQVLIRVEERMRGRGVMAQVLKLTFLLDSKKSITKELKFSEAQYTAHGMLSLLREFLSTIQWDSPLMWLELEVTDTVSYTPAQLFLFENAESRFRDLNEFVTKLRARYGEQAVGFPQLRESYLPEKSWEPEACPSTFGPEKCRVHFAERPLLLYTPPKPYQPARSSRLVPSESLDCEWWERAGKRQYYIAQGTQGEKLWVFRDGRSGQWYLHGMFD